MGGTIRIFKGERDRGPTALGTPTPIAVGDKSNWVAAADLDGDGVLDLAAPQPERRRAGPGLDPPRPRRRRRSIPPTQLVVGGTAGSPGVAIGDVDQRRPPGPLGRAARCAAVGVPQHHPLPARRRHHRPARPTSRRRPRRCTARWTTTTGAASCTSSSARRPPTAASTTETALPPNADPQSAAAVRQRASSRARRTTSGSVGRTLAGGVVNGADATFTTAPAREHRDRPVARDLQRQVHGWASPRARSSCAAPRRPTAR